MKFSIISCCFFMSSFISPIEPSILPKRCSVSCFSLYIGLSSASNEGALSMMFLNFRNEKFLHHTIATPSVPVNYSTNAALFTITLPPFAVGLPLSVQLFNSIRAFVPHKYPYFEPFKDIQFTNLPKFSSFPDLSPET